MQPSLGSVRSAMAGDVHAFGELVHAFDADLKRICFVITGERETAEDAVQLAWEIAWRKLSQLRSPDKARQWLIKVAVNEARRLARQPAGPIAGDEDFASDNERDLDLATALARLTLADRQVLSLTFVAGFTSAEAGRVMGLSAGGVRTRKARILTRLRKELGK